MISIDLSQAGTMINFNEGNPLGIIGDDGQILPKQRELKDEENEDMWVVHNALKINRIKQNINEDKTQRAKSAGEMALRFMGVNK